MTDSTGKAGDPTEREGPIVLRNAQRRIRNAYFDHDSGLFILDSNPGVGKTVTKTDIGAEELLRRFVNGDETPEQSLCVISFNRDEAAAFVPDFTARLRELVEHDMTPAAAAVSDDERQYLANRVRRAPHFGTIDSVFRQILGEFAATVGFGEMPSVGNEGQLTRLHGDCYEALVSNPAYAEAVDVVDSAYPPGEYDDGLSALLRQALEQCRARRLTTAEFTAELHATIEAVYAEGETTSFDDIAAALARCVGSQAATEACKALDETDREQLVAADQQLQAAWRETVTAFGTLLDAYRNAYETRSRERGVISHTDCAFLVAEFLSGARGTGDSATAKRERVLARYRERIESVIIDEAQDVSELQHAALAQLVGEDCRVLAVGDLQQTIYEWRDAHPSLFNRAVEEGQYLGVDWETHVTETAATTYRCTPDIAAAINAIAEPALTDPDRGGIGNLDVAYTPLDTARDATAGPSVHVAAFTTDARPGSPAYVAPERGKGEAGILATYIATGLADGTLTDSESDDQPDVTILFRWRTHMSRYADAFEAEGLSVANASNYLFECPVVKTVLDVAEWLVDPADMDRLQTLVTDTPLGLSTRTDTCNTATWSLDAIRDDTETADQQRDVRDRLAHLREKRPAFRAQSAAASIADIIEILALRADPNDNFTAVAPSQRIANLDALVQLITRWEGDSIADLSDVIDVFTPVRNEPYTGPTQPVTTTDEHDVVFKTVHQAKGDESDVVALADLGWPLRKLGPTSQRFVATGPMLGLAPPVNAAAPDINPLSAFTRGLYDPRTDDRVGSTPFPIDVGLRWASEHWADTVTTDHSSTGLAGHDRVQTASRRTRAEAFRILFVALSRAKQHLVVPLPRDIPGPEHPRDRWLETIRDGLQFDGTPAAGTYTLDVEGPNESTRCIDVAVNAVDTSASQATHAHSATPTPFVVSTPPDRDDLAALVPRFLQPSTIHPLLEDQDRYLLDHLQGRPLHTDTDAVDGELPLTLTAFDTEDVGKLCHSVLTRCVDRGMSKTAIRTQGGDIEQIIAEELHRHGPPANEAERDGLIEFLTEFVLPNFLASELWSQLEQAAEIYVEKRLRGHVRRDDVEFEIEGQADVVMQNPDGSWVITDIKIALTELTTETQRRYRTQISWYASLLAAENSVEGPITCAIETFGAVTNRRDSQIPLPAVQQRLDKLLNGGM
ncbi:exonuclease V subunit beta [Natrinema sp. CBA1119]|uniref:UvrD-helicase domain-containing protein n=1 Tax=Natrinema sp. CBA1119 TaxID=1608465 RepID=UPI000BF57A71|nr:UvrD-helicase domain-containing protein [Natrinema sp. CBA1119]PGF17204.1 exonuclease V subunit beta [Natrinema sp. CBA1119]